MNQASVTEYLSRQAHGPDKVLETLHEVRDRLTTIKDGGRVGHPYRSTCDSAEWVFADWNRCAVGHIYAVARGGVKCLSVGSRDHTHQVQTPTGLYEETLQAIVRANGIFYPSTRARRSPVVRRGRRSVIHQMVSDAVIGDSNTSDTTRLEATIRLVERTITTIEREYEQARRWVVNSTPVVESPPQDPPQEDNPPEGDEEPEEAPQEARELVGV